MKTLKFLTVSALLPALLSGCANMDNKSQSAGLGALLGCAAGAALAKATDNDATQACLAGALIGGLVGYQKARNEEIAEAKAAAEAAAQIKGARATPVRTEQVKVTDKGSGKTETVQAFKSVSVDIPISQLDTPDGKAAMRKLDAYAVKTARDRGETVYMTIAAAPGSAKKIGVANGKVVEKVGEGAIERRMAVDASIPGNVQRVTIEARNPKAVEV